MVIHTVKMSSLETKQPLGQTPIQQLQLNRQLQFALVKSKQQPHEVYQILNQFQQGLFTLPPTPGGLSWRSSNISYLSNELYFDLDEYIQVVVDATDTNHVSHGQLIGEITCHSKLSGMPDIICNFNQPRLLSGAMVELHPCIRSHKYERESILSFIPADGKFTLMNYVLPLQQGISLPLQAKQRIQFSQGIGKLESSLIPKSSKSFDGVSIVYPMPSFVKGILKQSCSVGSCVFDYIHHELKWHIGRIPNNITAAGYPMLSLDFDIDLKQMESYTPCVRSIRLDYKVVLYLFLIL